MANHASAEKRHRQSLRRRERNRFARATIRTAIKKAHSHVEEGNADAAHDAAKKATSLLDKAAIHGVIHKNTVRRSISRLNKKVASISK